MFNWRPLFVEPLHRGGSAPTPPDPSVAAAAGIQQQEADYPFSAEINALSQTGGNASLINPSTGLPQDYNFTGLGTADVQNQVSGQMAQVLLDIQNGLGSQFIAQRLADLQQSDPTGYAAYGQLFNQIQQEAAQSPPDMPLSQAVQSQINSVLQSSNTLSPSEMTQVQQQSAAGNESSGITLGNAPSQVTGTAAVNAVDQQQAQAQAAAGQYLQEGVTPSDIAFRSTQQNVANEGAFINGQNPTAEFSSLSGAQQGAAPTPNTGFQQQTLNEQQGAAQGIGQANQLFDYQSQLSNAESNPYLAGLSTALSGISSAANIAGGNPYSQMTNPFASTTTPQSQSYAAYDQFTGLGTPGQANSLPATTGVDDSGNTDIPSYA